MFSRDIGIDLGTANTLVYVRGKGIVLNEPSVVALDTRTKKVLAVGDEAKEMIGRTPSHIIALRPLRDGVIADFESTRAMLKYFIAKARTKARIVRRPRVLVCVPTGVTEVEKRAVLEAALAAGAKDRDVYLIEESTAAAIGAGLDIERPIGNMVVDIGGGTSEVAVLSLAGIVTSKSLDVAGDELDEHIITYVKREYGVAIGDRTAEELKKSIGYAYLGASHEVRDIRGRDHVTGLPRTLTLTADEVATAISEPVAAIIDAIKFTLEKTPPELSADIIENGIVLTGGGALLKGLDDLITRETGIPVIIATEPLNCVANGTGLALQHLKALKNALTTAKTLKRG
ncbi:MAG: rod shape-determining protein [Defluviitaleaceae bacterium]|nr:rod shape-determining protein [Defluviitaleaceae bacterium]